jgi:arginine decarboxylase
MDRFSMNNLVNRAKSALAAREGPARDDQAAAPIGDAIREYWKRNEVSFAIPAHTGGRGVVPDAASWMGIETFRGDLPMSHGVDTRNRAWNVQSTAQELFAEAVGADEVFFSTNGSSMSVHTAILAVAGPGDTIVMARNGHKSAFAGLVMSGATPAYVDPVYDERHDLAHAVRAEDLGASLDAHPNARAAMVFTPTYYGASADVAALADVCNARGLPLVTDDAWGLDYSFCAKLPPSALSQGADLAIGSVHKSLNGLSQTSVFSVQGDLIDRERLQLCFELEESTSASALLLSSIDGARRQFVRDGEQLLTRALEVADYVRNGVRGIEGLALLEPHEILDTPGVAHVDLTHVIIDVSALGITGYQADDFIRDHHQIDVELVDHRRLMALVTFAHDEAMADRLLNALEHLASQHADPRGSDVPHVPSPSSLRTRQAITPREAFFGSTKRVDIQSAVGEICAELITPYPPGIPVLAPGEVITESIVEYLQQFVAVGGFVEGASDQSLGSIRAVVRDQRR